ncbi:MAG: glycine--tRNA ligase [Gemmatimonadaceae bacterium]
MELKKNVKGSLVARDGAAGVTTSRTRCRHPHAPARVGSQRPRGGFTDPLVDCKACKARFRADKLEDAQCPRKPSKHPGQHTDCQLTEPRQFNLMFKTFMGPVEESASVVYLRPETAQGIYVNFLNVQQATRQKVPFGIAQIGKAFRNEITPGNFIFRTREFEQMEMQFFVDPQGDHMQWFEFWKAQRMEWHLSLGLQRDRLLFHQHTPQELAHYARAAFDIQFDFGGTLGFQEIEGVHHRGDFDLGRHQEYSGKKLEYFDQPNNRRFTPFVVETSVGADRTTLALLVNGYREEAVEGEEEGRVVLGLHPSLAPIKAGVFPLVKKDGMPEFAEKLAADLRPHFPVFYDESGAIGRRYRRQDEIGTPFCITVDGETTQNGTVTVRDRDSLKQERVAAEQLRGYITERVAV